MNAAATSSDLVAAVCCHAGPAVTPVAEDYSGVPIMLVFGEEDAIVAYSKDKPEWAMLSGLTSAGYFAEKNGCSGETTTIELDNGAKHIKYEGCPEGKEVEVLALPGVDHVPYLMNEELSKAIEPLPFEVRKE